MSCQSIETEIIVNAAEPFKNPVQYNQPRSSLPFRRPRTLSFSNSHAHFCCNSYAYPASQHRGVRAPGRKHAALAVQAAPEVLRGRARLPPLWRVAHTDGDIGCGSVLGVLGTATRWIPHARTKQAYVKRRHSVRHIFRFVFNSTTGTTRERGSDITTSKVRGAC